MTKNQKKKNPEKNTQLDFGIKEPLKNKYYKVKGKTDLITARFEIIKFLKDPIVWATIVICLMLITQQILLINENIDILPSQLPILRNFLSIEDRLAPKIYIYIFPAISGIIFILNMLVTTRNYNKERTLIKYLLFVTILCIISQTTILIDLLRNF